MQRKKERLSFKQLFVLSGAVFSMHFGTGCMIYPVTWGKESGESVLIAFVGVVLSGILLPFFGYVALSRTECSFSELVQKASPQYGVILSTILAIVNGPLYIIPRMSAAVWSAISQYIGEIPSNKVFIVIFNIVYYSIVLWFLSSRNKIVKRLGKIVAPILVIIVLTIIIKGIVNPLSSVYAPPTYEQSAILYGFLQGYATGDLFCALMFGIVIINGLKNTGVIKDKWSISLIVVGSIGLTLLALAHLGHMLIGANTGGTINLTLSALYMEVVIRLFGKAGGGVFLVALVSAAISASVGIGASSAEYFYIATKTKYSYNKISLIICGVSLLISSSGLERVVLLLGPVLDACYPCIIVIVIYYAFVPAFDCSKNLNGLLWAMIGTTSFSVFELFYTYNNLFNMGLQWYNWLYEKLPLSQYRLTWVPIAITFYFAGLFKAYYYKENRNKD